MRFKGFGAALALGGMGTGAVAPLWQAVLQDYFSAWRCLLLRVAQATRRGRLGHRWRVRQPLLPVVDILLRTLRVGLLRQRLL